MLSRRNVISSLLALPLIERESCFGGEGTLRSHAVSNHRLYGAAVRSDQLKADSQFATAVAKEVGILVSESETKRAVVEPTQNSFDFGGTDYLLEFAKRNNQKMRGHTLVWHRANPDWLDDLVVKTKDEKLLTSYIQKVVSRYAGEFHSWDVVNEVIEPADDHPQGLRTNSIWYKAFGPSYIETAFRAARQADPQTLLVYNETNIEGESRYLDKKRAATIDLLERLLVKRVPIDAFGIQGHLKAYKLKYSEKTITNYLDKIKELGLRILITEYDVADINGPRDIIKRDADVAALTQMFLGAAFSNSSVIGCLTWGLSDKYSWLSATPAYKWSDGEVSRGLPLDVNMSRKAMWDAIASAYQIKSH